LTKQELDLLELATGLVAQPSTCAAEIVWGDAGEHFIIDLVENVVLKLTRSRRTPVPAFPTVAALL
jgi:hypothetical protein